MEGQIEIEEKALLIQGNFKNLIIIIYNKYFILSILF